MSEVIDLQQRREATRNQYCYTCPCSNQKFVLRPDARVECSFCGAIALSLMWGQYFLSPSGIETGPLPESEHNT